MKLIEEKNTMKKKNNKKKKKTRKGAEFLPKRYKITIMLAGHHRPLRQGHLIII